MPNDKSEVILSSQLKIFVMQGESKIMGDFSPTRGSLVMYCGEIFYFQPMGSSCYLYDHADEVGRPELKRYLCGKKQISKPTKEEIKIFLANPRPRRQIADLNDNSSSSNTD